MRRAGEVIRLGSVPDLNARVLTWGLDEGGEETGRWALEHHAPSVLRRKLARRELDVALASSIEFFRNDDYVVVPGQCIAGQGEMWSVQLFLRGDLASARRIALDPTSETSNALLEVLLRERFGGRAETVRLPAGSDPTAGPEVDGFVKIGDAALRFRKRGWRRLDLAAEWRALAGLPFVFALWLTRRGQKLGDLPARLRHAKEEGLRHAAEIAKRRGPAAGLTVSGAKEYVRKIVKYEFGPAEEEALRQWGRMLVRHGLIERAREIEYLNGPPAGSPTPGRR